VKISGQKARKDWVGGRGVKSVNIVGGWGETSSGAGVVLMKKKWGSP